MNKIITLTVNPAVDKNSTVKNLLPDNKLRCSAPSFEAGGGGINVSRAIKELGGDSLCLFFGGGFSGDHLEQLVSEGGIRHKRIQTNEWTRENLSVVDEANGKQYRFVMPGANITREEKETILREIESAVEEGDYLVASGSLPPGMDVDFYAGVTEIVNAKNAKVILDTSGEPLKHGAKAGVFMLKPNLNELSFLCGVPHLSGMQVQQKAREFLAENNCQSLVVSMGPKGALLVTPEIVEHVPAPPVLMKNTVGAGDSMVAGMTLALTRGMRMREVIRYGVACGTAATMTEGADLIRKEDVDHLFRWINTFQAEK
ncbi:MAG: 1-phosphofructokinase family hexose kinase [Petrimonas sp.]|nr:1-phosphofructokinase family hexose kinase [Petrimonas sp.]